MTMGDISFKRSRSASTSPFLRRSKSNAGYRETFELVSVFGCLIFLLNADAFDAFFMSEDFNWTALYIAADEKFLPALFSHPFFLRPASIAWVIGTQILLPWDPLAHHTTVRLKVE